MISRAVAGILLLLMLPGSAGAKELLSRSVIERFLDEANPYVYTAVGQQYVAQARAEAAEGAFDTRLGIKYDNKRYPASEGELADVHVEKATESGVEFLFGYRRSEGVQEYNNIKTGDEGEIRMGVKVPLFAVASGMNERRYRLEAASLDAAQSTFASKENLRHLRFAVFSAYYTLLYRRAVSTLEADLLERARQRESFICGRVVAGEAPEIARLEARRLILNREQRFLEAKNGYDVALRGLLRYLGMSREAFEARYTLPPMPRSLPEVMPLEIALRDALAQRPDLKTLQYEQERFGLQEAYNSVSKYPKLNVALYGVHDFVYDNGFKLSVEMEFPIERRSYHGRKREIQRGVRAVDEAMARKKIEIRTALASYLDTRRMLRSNLQNAVAEITLAEQLEAAEVRKYRLGAADLMTVNQRELTTLSVRQKKLSYQLRLLLLGLEIDRERGTLIGERGRTTLLERPGVSGAERGE